MLIEVQQFCFSFIFIIIGYLVSNRTKKINLPVDIGKIYQPSVSAIVKPQLVDHQYIVYTVHVYILYLLQRNLLFILNAKHKQFYFSQVPDLSTADQWSCGLQHWWLQQYLLRPPRTSAPVWSGLVGWSA